ncbi:MAG: hypothetical protein JWQ43_2874 [Glaciihabitans sp.]|nr:hypothetical protein [Glaciihabitans sp.]
MTPRPARAATEGVAHAHPRLSWDIALQTSPTRFYPKFGPLPAVTEVRDQPSTWDGIGFTRTLMLSDGGSVVETITDSSRGEFFAYNLSDFQKLLGALVTGGRAEWTFTEQPGGTRIRWTYEFHPRPGRGWIVQGIVRFLWAPYMRRVMPRIVRGITREAAKNV